MNRSGLLIVLATATLFWGGVIGIACGSDATLLTVSALACAFGLGAVRELWPEMFRCVRRTFVGVLVVGVALGLPLGWMWITGGGQ